MRYNSISLLFQLADDIDIKFTHIEILDIFTHKVNDIAVADTTLMLWLDKGKIAVFSGFLPYKAIVCAVQLLDEKIADIQRKSCRPDSLMTVI